MKQMSCFEKCHFAQSSSAKINRNIAMGMVCLTADVNSPSKKEGRHIVS